MAGPCSVPAAAQRLAVGVATMSEGIRAESDSGQAGLPTWLDVLLPMAERWLLLLVGSVVTGALALAASYLITPTYTARASILPAQQQQNATLAALSQLGPLAGFAGGVTGVKSAADQYISLMESVRVADRIVDRFDLMKVHASQYRFEARNALASRVRIAIDKKGGLIVVEVDDHDPKRAADIANQYVAELKRLTSELALTEAQQRRALFETKLQTSREALAQAQRALQASGFNAAALRAEPRATADAYAKLKAAVSASEVRLQALRRTLTDSAVEVQQQLAELGALRRQLGDAEVALPSAHEESDFVGKYREFKYHEALVELYSKQTELARLDEGREGGLIQVVDVATPPEWKSKPKRGVIALSSAIAAFFLFACFLYVRRSVRTSRKDPATDEKYRRLTSALLLRRSGG